MEKLKEAIGFLEMLKGLNKTVVEIDLIMPKLEEIEEDIKELCRKAFYEAREFMSIDGLVDIDQIADLPKDLSPNVFDSDAWINNNFFNKEKNEQRTTEKEIRRIEA